MSDVDLAMIGPDRPMLHTCPFCDQPAEHHACCSKCFHDGAMIRQGMPDVISSLAAVTELEWEVVHTGGGVFILEAYLDREDENSPSIAIGHGDDGVLDGCATTSDGDRLGWTFGCYADGSLTPGRSWLVGLVSTEDLPKRVAAELPKLMTAWHSLVAEREARVA